MPGMRYTTLFVLVFLFFLWACKKEKQVQGTSFPTLTLPAIDYTYGTDTFPAHFDGPPLNFINSINYPITNAGAKLGRVLFYDKLLSVTNTVACGSCHQQRFAFSDPQTFSPGVNGHITDRHSMAIFNTRYERRFFWDHRALTIEDQVLQPIQNPKEMGMSLTALVNKLEQTNYYPPLFEEAFGTPEINTDRISIALGMFIQSIVTYKSKYDMGEQTGFANYTALEYDGYQLFNSGVFNCNHCHGTANFTFGDILNNGIDSLSPTADPGRGAITGDPSDIGKFKVPSLRNIALTAPYMHDGRFATLEQVVEHYNSGIRQHPNLDDRLTTNVTTGGPPKRYHMTAYEKKALVAFLKTLTDEALTTEPKWSNPFK